MNKVFLSGYVTSEIMTKEVQGGIKVAKFKVLTRHWQKVDGKSKTLFEHHNIECWRNLAVYSEKNIRKGSRVVLEGKLHTERWIDEKGKHSFTIVNVKAIEVMSEHTPYHKQPENM